MVRFEQPSLVVIPVSLKVESDATHITVRPPTRDDASRMWRLARSSVDGNSPYAYLMLVEYLSNTCAVAVDDETGDLAGFVTGFRLPDDQSTLFIWQIAVAAHHRGSGIGSMLLDGLADRPVVPRLRFLEASVTPDNDASATLFRRFAERRSTECAEDELFGADDFPGDHDHDPEIRFRIGPF